MDKQTLTVKRDAIKGSFDQQTKIRNDAEAEQVRLQGEYRLIEELLGKLDEEIVEGDVK